MKNRIGFILLWAFIVLLAACAGQEAATQDVASQETAPQEATQQETAQPDTETEAPTDDSAAGRTVFPLTITDASGAELVFERAPERIVSISPAETEVLFAIGLGDKIVGVSDFCNYPEETLAIPKVGGIVSPNIEALIATEADLVVGGISLGMESAESIREHGMNLYIPRPGDLHEVIDSIRALGLITDHNEQAAALIAKMEADIETVDDAVSTLSQEQKKRVYIEISPGWTVGRGEFMHELIERAGGINIAEDLEGWNQINEEIVIAANPEVIIFPEGIVLDDAGTTMEDMIAGRPGWEAIEAIATGNLHPVDADVLTRPGARVTEALLMLAELFHPERFR